MTCSKTDPECLRAAASHVSHDVRMLREAWNRQGDPLAYTAWFILCRSVMDFFEARSTRPDDVQASHYFDEAESWASILDSCPTPEGYATYREAVNKLAAHLTYSRIDYARSRDVRPSLALTEYLLGLTDLFLRHLSPERAAWFGGLRL